MTLPKNKTLTLFTSFNDVNVAVGEYLFNIVLINLGATKIVGVDGEATDINPSVFKIGVE